MSVHLFTVSFQAASMMPADAMVNTFYFEGSGSDFVNVADMLQDFYQVQPAGAATSISGNMSTQALTGQMTIKAYDLSDPKPRAPLYSTVRNLAGMSSGSALPAECALVMSYNSTLVSGVPAARRRGRIYLGGLNASLNQAGRPTDPIRATIVRAGRNLIQASNASVSWDWVQYSQVLGVGNTVVGGWCDNAWDTQRRRGVASSARTTFTGGTP